MAIRSVPPDFGGAARPMTGDSMHAAMRLPSTSQRLRIM
jgi:hypothetical protein